MKCKLNPSVTDFLYKTFLWITCIPLGIIVIVAVYIGIGIVGASTIQSVDADWLYLLLVSDSNLYHDSAHFWLTIGNKLIWVPVGILVFIGAGIVALYATYLEIKEALHQRKYHLQYRFETNKVPWYRVLLSYIIVCEKTKDL